MQELSDNLNHFASVCRNIPLSILRGEKEIALIQQQYHPHISVYSFLLQFMEINDKNKTILLNVIFIRYLT